MQDRWRHWAMKRRGLRYLILYLLASKGSMTGAQISDEVERASMGMWRPSPGSLYPMLDELEKEGLIRIDKVEGTKKYYVITEAGRNLVGPSSDDRLARSVDEFTSMARYILDNWDKLRKEDRDRIRSALIEMEKVIGGN
nr:PadR family transcriptional regulator [Thermocladium modestius]